MSSLSYSFGGGPVGQPVTMTWDPAVGGWARTQKGTPHVDAAGVQVAPANVIIQFTPYAGSGVADQFGNDIPEAQTVGEGDACDFTAVGDAVNTTARLASSAGAGEILVSKVAADASKLDATGLEERTLTLRGKDEMIDALVLAA